MTIATTIRNIMTLTSLLAAVACGGTASPSGGDSQGSLSSNQTCTDEEEEGAADKLTCREDSHCDADEVCLNGRCTGMDGEAEDGTCEDEADDKVTCAADAECDADEVCSAGVCAGKEDEEEDEDEDDKVTCAADRDCDSDETCASGRCTGVADPCSSDSECDADEACTNGNCEDR